MNIQIALLAIIAMGVTGWGPWKLIKILQFLGADLSGFTVPDNLKNLKANHNNWHDLEAL